MKATLGIADYFSDSGVPNPDAHGFTVEQTAQTLWGGGALHYDFQSPRTSIFALSQAAFALSEQGATVVNISFAGGKSSIAGQTGGFDFQGLVEKAFLRGTFTVASSGNGWSGLDAMPTSSAFADNPFVVSAAALDYSEGAPKKAWYSQFAPGITNFALDGTFEDAHGALHYGTSFSAPRLSALFCSVQDRFPGLSMAQAYSIVETTSSHIALEQDFISGSCIDFAQVPDPAKALAYDPALAGAVTPRMVAESAYELMLDRQPDEQGLEWWSAKIAENAGAALDLAAQITQGERISRAELSGDAVARNVYERVPVIEKTMAMYHLFLGREADDAGLAYWMGVAEHNRAARPESDLIDWASIERSFVQAALAGGETPVHDAWLWM